MSILTVITLLIQFLPQILESAGVISPAIEGLIKSLGASIPGLISALASGKSVPDDVMTLLSEFQTEIGVLKAEGTLAPHALGMADTLTLALAQAVHGYQQGAIETAPQTLTPLPTNLTNELEPTPAPVEPQTPQQLADLQAAAELSGADPNPAETLAREAPPLSPSPTPEELNAAKAEAVPLIDPHTGEPVAH